MSVSASIDIQLGKVSNEKISALQVINTFITNKWRIQNDNNISYLPLGDEDSFEWQSDDISVEQLINIVEKKESHGEIIGILMFWDSTEIGVELLIRSELELSFNLSINRKLIGNTENTDINWYIEKIVVLLKENNYIIEYFSFDEYS